jgi:hypothetical protein
METAREKAAQEKRKKSKLAKALEPGQDDDFWSEEDVKDEANNASTQETRVGKKLSEMTTRRLILLILGMMLVLPLMQAEEANQTAFSASYGADHVWHSFLAKLDSQGSSSSSSAQLKYERALLQYAYYHNWYSMEDSKKYCKQEPCSGTVYYGQVFWIGIVGKDSQTLQNQAGEAQIRADTVDTWVDEVDNPREGSIYNYGTMPSEVKSILKGSWDRSCNFGTDELYLGISLIDDSAGDDVSYPVNCPEDLRISELSYYVPRLITESQFDSWHLVFFYDMRPFNRQESFFNLGIMIFILILLLLGSLMFSHDANKLVLKPVEKMISRVEAIRENPLAVTKMADDEFKAEELAKSKVLLNKEKGQRAKKFFMDVLMCDCMQNESEIMETVILEKTIIKLGSLLVLGFGEAGARIIAQNLSGASSKMNAMVSGYRIDCVIGVVRVRDFGIATQVLQSKIHVFGNQIAEIVHGVCNEFYGAPNKNNGDFFLIVWRVDEKNPGTTQRLAEMSVVSFATILGALHRSPVLASYRQHPGLQNRWSALRRNGRVNLSFGLHAGWAIEGAIGTEFKIDASYLSPNVNIAKSVELATEIYGVSFMVSQSVVELCTQRMVDKCRLIDRVVIKGQSTPMDLYCVDLDFMNVRVDDSEPLKVVWNNRLRFKARQQIEYMKTAMMEEQDQWIVLPDEGIPVWKERDRNSIVVNEQQKKGSQVQGIAEGGWLRLYDDEGYIPLEDSNGRVLRQMDMADIFDLDHAIHVMRKRYTVEFLQLFNMGYQNYAQGEWNVARIFLSMSRSSLKQEDGPSQALLRFMEEPYNFKAPENWQVMSKPLEKVSPL